MIRMAALLLILSLGPAAAWAGLTLHRLDHDGLERTYRLFVPDRSAAFDGPRPLVVVLHGGGGSSREVRLSTRRRFEELAKAHGFYVLYPDAVGRIWDTGSGTISGGLSPRRDDAGFLRAAIAAVGRDHPLDPARIFATGVSRGGMESYALACAHPGLVRAIAAVAMPMPEASARDCGRGAPLGFLLIHGTADPIVPYAGGPINLGRRDRDRVLSAAETMARFARRNGCGAAQTRMIGKVRHADWQGCATATGFYSVGGGGHGWPGGRKLIPGGRAGPVNADIVAADEIWAFFSRF